MKLNRVVGLTFISLFLSNVAKAQQPYGGCWHPDFVKTWTPETDPNAKFNRSRVPLAKRFKEPTLMKANQYQFYEGQVCNSTILFPTCSLCPSQGANNFVGYQPTYWQYMDKLVYWAGSASEGIIIPPPAGSIDAAHQSGVKVLGQIFFPPSVYGGKQEWVREVLTKENGKYIFAQKLYEIAKYLGFEGWFINEETGGAQQSEWKEFIDQFHKIADEHGDNYMEIQWYNASHQPATSLLAGHKQTSQFIEYGSVGDFSRYASQMNCTKEDVFSKIYGGIQCVNAGLAGFGRDLRNAFPRTGHVGSVDLFCPEERIWKDNVKDLLNTSSNNGPMAYSAMERTFYNEDITWVNRQKDPSNIIETPGSYNSWPGIAGCVLERSAISSMPFTTSFCVGIGKYRFVEGKKLNVQDWYHSGMQSVMPTWRWWIENKDKNFEVKINWEDAYNLGNSIKAQGVLTKGEHLMRLYKTMIDVKDGGKLTLVYKTSNVGSFDVKLATESKVNGEMETLTNPTLTTKNNWTVAEYSLESLKGKTIYMIALNLKAQETIQNYYLTLGQLQLIPSNYKPSEVEITNLVNQTTLKEEEGDLRLTWDWKDNADLDHFDIYTQNDNGDKKLVGQTRDEAFYVPRFVRLNKTKVVNVSVVPIMKDGSEGKTAKLDVNYPAPKAPVVTLNPDKSYVKVGDVITIKAKGTGQPTAWKWQLPQGLELAQGSSLEKETIKVVAKTTGTQTITVLATNDAGTSTTKVDVVDVMTDSEMQDVKNVALKKRISSYSGATSDEESPKNIIDGVENPSNIHQKWCNINSNHECVIDLQSNFRIYGFKIFDCKSGPENNTNIDNYRIYLSEDGKKWTLVVDAKNRYRDNIKTDNIVPTKARYVKLNPYSDDGFTMRMWEFEVFGVNSSKMTFKIPETLTLNVNETKSVALAFDLKGEERQEPFTCSVKVDNDNVKVGEVYEMAGFNMFNIPLTAADFMGVSTLTFELHNGSDYKEKTLKVVVDNKDAVNVLKNKTATARIYDRDYSYSAKYAEKQLSGLTDGNTTIDACSEIESERTHKQDFWTVFKADKTFNISKVRISIPNNNQGESSNDKKGNVNKTIEIWTSGDARTWKRDKVFDNLTQVSTLEYMYPEYRAAKYLAIVCTLNPYFYPSIAEVEAFEQSASVVSQCVPVKIKEGFNKDIFVEATPASEHSNGFADVDGWNFYTSNVKQEGAIAGADRVVNAKDGDVFLLEDYTKNNALVLDKAYSTYELKFAQPEVAEKLYFLYTCTGGNANIETRPVYEDGTTGESLYIQGVDWFGYDNDSDIALYGLSRIMCSTTNNDAELNKIDERLNFRIFKYDLETNKNKKLVGVKFRNFSYSANLKPVILAVSKFGPGKFETSINGIELEQQNAQIVAIYTATGMKVNTLVNGLNIVKFSDGTTKKIIVRK